jgi:hypothetical protein
MQKIVYIFDAVKIQTMKNYLNMRWTGVYQNGILSQSFLIATTAIYFIKFFLM